MQLIAVRMSSTGCVTSQVNFDLILALNMHCTVQISQYHGTASCACKFAVQVGFVVGTDGIVPFLKQCMLQPLFVLCTLVVCFSAVQIMFELRAIEQEQKQVPQTAHVQAHALSHQVFRSKAQQAEEAHQVLGGQQAWTACLLVHADRLHWL